MLLNSLFARPETQTEWWYYHGHLHSGSQHFGFHAAFFRRKAHDITVGRIVPIRLATDQLWFAHFGLTEITAKRFRYGQRRAFRNGGAARDRYHVWVGDWSCGGDERQQYLQCGFGDVTCNLQLSTAKAPVCHETGGCRRDGENAPSHWSFSRMHVDGELVLDGRRIKTTGQAWMDRECGTLAFNPFEQGWDWFGVQLDGDRELMIYGLRDKDGRPSPKAHAVCIEPDGRRIVLSADEFRLMPKAWWTSSRTGCTYPVAWTLSIPRFAAELSIQPYMRNHELDTGGSTNVNYWEGPAAVRGSWNGASTSGRCFAELVGYDRKSHSGRFDFYTASFSFGGLLRSEMSRWATRAGTINLD